MAARSIALVETKPSRTNFAKEFDNSFEFDQFQLCSDSSVKRVLKKDVDIDFDPDKYEWVILVGSDACKYYTKNATVTDYSGKIVDEKFIPVINPAMVSFKPESARLWEDSKKSIIDYVTGKVKKASYSLDKIYGIKTTEKLKEFLLAAIASPNSMIALDSETTSLYPRGGYVLGISLSYERDHGAYIDADCIDSECEELFQELFNKKTVVFHNAKFDIAFFKFHFGWTFPRYEDTMLLHYCIDENPGTHGLKQLALKYTNYGDYEQELNEWKDAYCKKHGIKKDDFTYDLIPFDVMYKYAAIDAIVTLLLFIKFKPAVTKNKKLNKVYNEILIPANNFILDIQDNGVPFDIERLKFAQVAMQTQIDKAVEELYKEEVIKEFEAAQGKEFNPNSVVQLRTLLFDYVGLKPTGKKTGTGQNSTDAEVLQQLASQHHIPNLILEVRKKGKIKNTYLDKIIPALDRDGRLRTNFNLHGTTSGRLSSSGTLNMQQLPRDDPSVKGCIKAKPGYKIVSMDLQTAEVYLVAVLSGDKELQKIFIEGGDFHSTIAKRVFHLDEAVEDIKAKHPLLRQAAKSTTFGILYQAGPETVMQQVQKEAKDRGIDISFTIDDAKEAINAYFKQFKTLKKWIDENKKFIEQRGYTYSYFGRKRRLPNVLSSDNAVKGHAIRSGINFLVQSPASDVNLLAGIECNEIIKKKSIDATIFALVHDSILAEVKEEHIKEYQDILRSCVQKDRGLSIKGYPIGCDFEVGDDYSFGKFEKLYGLV